MFLSHAPVSRRCRVGLQPPSHRAGQPSLQIFDATICARQNDAIGMNVATLLQEWDQIRPQLKQRFDQLTDDDLAFPEGKGEELLERLQEKLHVSHQEIEIMLDGLAAKGSRRIWETTERYVHRNPLGSMLVAIVVGFVVGFTIRR